MKAFNIWIAAATLAMGLASTASSATLVNGSLTGSTGAGTVPTGWTINSVTPDTTSSGIQPFPFTVNPGDSPDGGTWVGLARDNSLLESIGQTVTDFVVGAAYTLSWYVTNTGCCNGGFSAAAEILSDIDGITMFTGTSRTIDGMWYKETYDFVATSVSHTLDFRLDFGNKAYMGIDGISLVKVAVVPIPASLPLLAFALGGLGLMRRRKKG